jgi:hypothetical protein
MFFANHSAPQCDYRYLSLLQGKIRTRKRRIRIRQKSFCFRNPDLKAKSNFNLDIEGPLIKSIFMMV